MKVLVLGHTGMLGHMVYKYLSLKDCEIITTDLKWPSQKFKEFVLDFKGDFIVNCIGAIPQRKNNFEVNKELPIWLEQNNKIKIIHPGTDGEDDNNDYGISKKEATEFLINGKNTTIIKTCIIGPELDTQASLMQWFLDNKSESVEGYSMCYWNGITTLQWSKMCYKIMCSVDEYEVLNIPVSNCISKYDLLNKIKTIFNKKIKIIKNSDVKINRCLIKTNGMPAVDIETQLKELKEFYYDS